MNTLTSDREVYYRYDCTYQGEGYFDEFGDYCPMSGGKVLITLREHPVVGKTPKGVWVQKWDGSKTLVLNDARKKFACPTKDEAWKSFLARKRRQRAIVIRQAVCAQIAIEQAAPHLSGADESCVRVDPAAWRLQKPDYAFAL